MHLPRVLFPVIIVLLAGFAKAEAGAMQQSVIMTNMPQMQIVSAQQSVTFFPVVGSSSDAAMQATSNTASFSTVDETTVDTAEATADGTTGQAPVPASFSSSSTSSSSSAGLFHTYAGPGTCNASFLNIFEASLSCGDKGAVFPVLYNGECPITACILSTGSRNGFGGPMDF